MPLIHYPMFPGELQVRAGNSSTKEQEFSVEFYDVDPKDIELSPLEAFAKDWALVTAGTPESWNTMTIGWGGLGTLWSEPMATVYVRPDRYTHEFMESSERFTIAFFNEKDHDKLAFCGSNSGRDTDKTTCGITPMEVDDGAVAFEEAELILACRKVYSHDFDARLFADTKLRDRIYGAGAPLHTAYWGIVEHVYVAKSVLDDAESCNEDGCNGDYSDSSHG